MDTARKLTIAYWIVTVIFAIYYIMGAIYDIISPQLVLDTLAHLGYPPYFGRILGIMKVLGVIVLFLPGTNRLREWAYAGITFNLLFAFYSHVMSGDGALAALPLIPLAFALASYALWRKRSTHLS